MDAIIYYVKILVCGFRSTQYTCFEEVEVNTSNFCKILSDPIFPAVVYFINQQVFCSSGEFIVRNSFIVTISSRLKLRVTHGLGFRLVSALFPKEEERIKLVRTFPRQICTEKDSSS